jgi:hypothetical protein
MDHCRREENGFFRMLAPGQDAARLQLFRDGHERLGIDLDKFERQMSSYQLSGDPGVLLPLGERVIRELGEHLAAEEECVKGVSSPSPLHERALRAEVHHKAG